MNDWRTGCVQYMMRDGHRAECLDQPEPVPVQLIIILVPLIISLGLLLWQLRKARLEREHREAERVARYNRFLELLRDVKWNLLNRNYL